MTAADVLGYTVVGIVLGTAVDRLISWLQRMLGLRGALCKLVLALGVLVCLPVVLATSPVGDAFVRTWQTTIPGLYFAAMLFGTQSTMMANLQEAVSLFTRTSS